MWVRLPRGTSNYKRPFVLATSYQDSSIKWFTFLKDHSGYLAENAWLEVEVQIETRGHLGIYYSSFWGKNYNGLNMGFSNGNEQKSIEFRYILKKQKW